MTVRHIRYPQSTRADSNYTETSAGVPATRILGVPVSSINMSAAVDTILNWIVKRDSNYVCVRDVHGIMRSQEDAALMEIHEEAGLITPDGMPLLWLLRARGYKEAGRVCGADLVAALCEASASQDVRHYFYGGKPGVAERMAENLIRRFPTLRVVGTETPPFHALTDADDLALTEKIAATKPDIVWVGLSTPKQEYWMRDHVGRISGATLIGIGAAFDFYAGDVKRAPTWMHHSGLEWLHRLASEPRRLWRRYLVLAPKFVIMIAGGSRSDRRRHDR